MNKLIGMGIFVLGSLTISLFGSVLISTLLNCHPVQGFVVLVGGVLIVCGEQRK